METISSIKPLIAVLIPLAAVLLIGLSKKHPNMREGWTLLAALIEIAVVGSLVLGILQGQIIVFTLGTLFPGLTISFRVDNLGVLFGATASILWLFTSIYSMGYMRSLNEHFQTRFYIAFAIAISATMGLAFSANLFTLFTFYEILTLCTYPLVIHKQTTEAFKAGKRYLTYLLGTSIGFQLLAIFLTYHVAGTLDFSEKGILAGKGSPILLTVIFFLFIAGTAKAALIPFHSWLPTAMVAPTPVSALLHAVAVVKAGVFTVFRILLHIFGIDLLSELGLGLFLSYLAVFTIITASIIALRQNNLKLRLAYSTISQLAFMVLGGALLTPSGTVGGMINIAIHAFGKITLFFCAGAIYVAAHKTLVSELDGIARKMPWTMAAFTLGALSLIGFPPLAGFIAKWFLVLGALEAGQWGLAAFIIFGSLLTAAYLLPIIYGAYFKKGSYEEMGQVQEAPLLMLIPIILTAAGTVILFFWPSPLLDLARGVR